MSIFRKLFRKAGLERIWIYLSSFSDRKRPLVIKNYKFAKAQILQSNSHNKSTKKRLYDCLHFKISNKQKKKKKNLKGIRTKVKNLYFLQLLNKNKFFNYICHFRSLACTFYFLLCLHLQYDYIVFSYFFSII